MASFDINQNRTDRFNLPHQIVKKTLDAARIVHLHMLHKVIAQLIKEKTKLQSGVHFLQNQIEQQLEFNNYKLAIISEAVRVLSNIESASQTEVDNAARNMALIWSSHGNDLQRIRSKSTPYLRASAAKNAITCYQGEINLIQQDSEVISNGFKSLPIEQNLRSCYISFLQLNQKKRLLEICEDELKQKIHELHDLRVEMYEHAAGRMQQSFFTHSISRVSPNSSQSAIESVELINGRCPGFQL